MNTQLSVGGVHQRDSKNLEPDAAGKHSRSRSTWGTSHESWACVQGVLLGLSSLGSLGQGAIAQRVGTGWLRDTDSKWPSLPLREPGFKG